MNVVFKWLHFSYISYKTCGLAVLASGLWVAPGDSEEVAAALSQALRNCIERLMCFFGP